MPHRPRWWRRQARKRRERGSCTADEIRAVWAVAGGLGYPFGPFFQLALITGQRREEVAQLQWPHVDLHEMTWTLPAEATKAARTHVVPLAPLAIDILKALPRKTVTDGRGTKPSRYAFTTSGEAPISGFSKAKTRLDLAIAKARDGVALAPWTIHDARRTAATEMGRLGVSRFIIGKVLNHADRSVTGIYDRHAYLQEKRHALETWAAYLDSLSRPSGGNVMPLRQVTG